MKSYLIIGLALLCGCGKPEPFKPMQTRHLVVYSWTGEDGWGFGNHEFLIGDFSGSGMSEIRRQLRETRPGITVCILNIIPLSQ